MMDITLKGTVTIAGANETREVLAQALATCADLRLTLDVTEIDLCTVQLIMAADVQARREGGGVRLAAPPSGPVADILRRSAIAANLWNTASPDLSP